LISHKHQGSLRLQNAGCLFFLLDQKEFFAFRKKCFHKSAKLFLRKYAPNRSVSESPATKDDF
jgi:hypothetical protein